MEFRQALKAVSQRIDARELYPEIEPYEHGMLPVSTDDDENHVMYYELCGNKDAKTTVFVVHGGPGGGCNSGMRRFFCPKRYRIVLFDQRGCGRSTPHSLTLMPTKKGNNTWALIADMEKLRKHLGIEGKVGLFGGSWGSTLCLAYAITHPERVQFLLLRGIFLVNQSELRFLYQFGACCMFPEAWERSGYESLIPEAERGDFIAAYHKRLFPVLEGKSEAEKAKLLAEQQAAAFAWSMWEGCTSFSVPKSYDETLARFGDPKFSVAFATIENLYFVNRGFFSSDSWILDNAHKLKDIPTVMVHGRMDVVCHFASAYQLKQRMPHAVLLECPLSGHAASEPDLQQFLVAAADKFVEGQ